MPDISEMKRQLAKAQEWYARTIESCAAKPLGGGMDEYWEAHGELLRCERELAAAKGEEHAVPLDFPVQWDIGAPLPHLLANDYRALLSFYLREPDPDWDGTYVTMSYPLWLQTFELLRNERSDDPDHVLLTRDGRPLRTDVFEGEKYKKTDAVRLAVRRLTEKTEIKFTLKACKKTSASLLRNHRDYKGLEPVSRSRPADYGRNPLHDSPARTLE